MSDETAIVPVLYPTTSHTREAQNPARLYLKSLRSPTSQRTMLQAIKQLLAVLDASLTIDTCPWHELRYEHLQHITDAMREREIGETSIAKALIALRRIARQAYLIGQMSFEVNYKIQQFEIHRLPPGRQTAKRQIKPGEIAAILRTAIEQPSPKAERDAAIIAMLYGCGLRRAELCRLQKQNYLVEDRCLHLRGKRGRERTIPMPEGTILALDRWLAIRQPVARTDFLFLSLHRGGKINQQTPLTPDAIYYILQELAEAANVRTFGAHDLRRSYAGDLLDAGVDLPTVQQLMGHSSPTTTAQYDRRPGETRKQAVARLHVPFIERKAPPSSA